VPSSDVSDREPDTVEAANVRVDTCTRDVRLGDVRLVLAQKEYELLPHMAREPHRVFTNNHCGLCGPGVRT